MVKRADGRGCWELLLGEGTQANLSARFRKILIADSDERWRERIAKQLGNHETIFGCGTTRELRELALRHRPDLTILELRLADGPALGCIAWLKENCLSRQIVVATNYDSIATAVRCSQLGVNGYYVKDSLLAWPVTEAGWQADLQRRPMPLARAVWEHLNRAVEQTGSISAAADRLGLDRRSLRRMLGKHAPPGESPSSAA